MVLSDDVRGRVRSYIQHQAGKSREAIIDLIGTSQTKYLELISGVPEATTGAKPAPDEWSIRELTLHVITAEDGVTRIIDTTSKGGSVATGERVLGFKKDDEGAPFSTLVSQLRESNARLLDAVRDLPSDANVTETAQHPFFGPLNCLEWAVFQRVHDEDHLQHAAKIIAAVS